MRSRRLADRLVPLLQQAASRVRSRHLFVLDVIALTLVAPATLLFWLEARNGAASPETYLWLVGIIVSAQAATSIALGLYHHSWRFASVSDMGRIILCVTAGTLFAVAIATLVAAAAVRFLDDPAAPIEVPSTSFWLLEWSLTLCVVALPRFAIRATSELRAQGAAAVDGAKRTLLYGAGWAGVTVARSAMRSADTGIEPVGFLDDDANLTGRHVAGLRVFGGLDALTRAVRRTRATTLLVTMPSAAGDAVRRVAESAMEHGLEVRTVPPVSQTIDGTLDASRVRKLRVEDLLRRPLAKEHTPRVVHAFSGRIVAITGAAGSIGSELARQVIALQPSQVVLIDHAESPLFHVEREILELIAKREASGVTSHIEVATALADVTSYPLMVQVFATHRPDIVLHAAAYKHVPLLEDQPSEAVKVNMAGTMNVVDAAAGTGVARFVLVSTDKAVWPSSVMGATKRTAEMLVADAGRRLGRPYISVRFGNVLGSNGSVVPIFQDQLEKGQPLTITHPDMTRYFMTIPEAAWLILDAAAIARQAGLFVLDMGEPVRILDIARDLSRLAGRDPDSVPISYIGLRKGEKLHESLFYDQETVHPTEVPKVLRADAPPAPPRIREDVRDLLVMADGKREEQLRGRLHAYVRWATVAREFVQADDQEAIPLPLPPSATSDEALFPEHVRARPKPRVPAGRIQFASPEEGGELSADWLRARLGEAA
jgi:FlaA1/EpsC-like NDP-sugar epimerase